MATSTPLQNFGIHQITMKDLTDPSIMGVGKVLGDVTPELSQELIDNRGGSSAFPWASAPGEATGEISVIIKQYDKNLLRFINPYIAGSLVEDEDGDTAGYASVLVNQTGTSVLNAVTGIASIAIDSTKTADLAYGDYVLKATAAGTFDLYLNTDISGTASYDDDTYKINAAVITLPGTGAKVTSQGIEFTSGSGAATLVVGDMATFSIRPINSYMLTSYIGKDGASPQEFELTIVAEKIGNKIRVIKFPRCIAGGGANLKFVYKDWSMIETTIKILKPSTTTYVGVQEFMNR